MLRPIVRGTSFLLQVLVLFSASHCFSQQTTSPVPSPIEQEQPASNSAESPASLTIKKVDEEAKAIQASESLDDNAKAELLKRYKAASDWLASARDAEAKTAQYEDEVRRAPDVQQLKSELALPQAEPDIQLPSDITLAQLEQLATNAEARLNDAQQKLGKRKEEIKGRADRKGELAKLLEETKQRLEEAQQQLIAPPPSDEAPEMTAARRTEFAARIIALKSTLILCNAETSRSNALAERFPLQRDQAKREKNFHEKEVAAYQQLVSKYRKTESERQAQEAQETRRRIEMDHPALRDVAEHNAVLAEKGKVIAETITQVANEVKHIEKRLERLKSDFEKATYKVEKVGHSATVGLMLRKQREELPAIGECEERLRFVEQKMPKANLDRLEFEEQREALGDMEAAVDQVVSALPQESSSSSATYLEQAARQLLQSQRDLLDKLDNDYDAYLSELSELELSNQSLISETRKFNDFIDEHVLWIRSAERLKSLDSKHVVAGILELTKPAAWIGLAKTSGIDTFQRPMMAMAVLVGAVFLIVLQTRLGSRIRYLCETKSASSGVRFWPTIEALLLAALTSVQWPLLSYYFGWRMTIAQSTSALGLALGPALQYGACLFWFSAFARHICRDGGIAAVHFGWSSYGLSLARRKLRWLTFVGIPLAVVVVLAQIYQQGEWANSLGRIAFIAVMSLLARFFHLLLRGKDNVLREAIARNSSPWLSHVRVLAHLSGIAVPVCLAVLAAIGYYYSAQQLAFKLQTTIGLISALVLLYAVASRWFLVKRRGLAIQQARERQQQTAQSGQTKESSSPSPVQVEEQQPDLSSFHEKLLLLLRHAVTVCVLVGSWFIWSDVLPALRVLDGVVLWEKTIKVTEPIEVALGQVELQKIPKDVATTLRHAIIAGLFLLATFVLGKNLPALLEITVLNRLPLDTGGRHAVSVILHYSVALTGFLLACRTMNITWSSVQWLAAGMTVGLAFGLQEVFANFVCGLILLFERPIRVGDIITLGDTTGRVTNIRIRATTVTNWDRKELIVPNKDLITGRLLNWTLSDTTNRIVITVGVAYKSDPEKTRDILASVLQEHPNVLDDPAPNVTFEGFGDSTLNFVIRAYLASMDNRLSTIHQLHSTIHRRLGEADIEIAFPQRDINVRHLPHALELPVQPQVGPAKAA